VAKKNERRPGLIRPLLRFGAAAALGYAATGKIHDADEKARAIVAGRRSEFLDQTLPVVTDLGSMYAAGGAATALWFSGNRKLARDVLGSAALAWGIAQGAKRIFRRPRPYDAGDVQLLVRRPAGESYPSGHPAVAAAMVGVVTPEVRPFLRAPLQRLPRFVGFSRVYVGAHYPSDVAGGVMIGKAVAELWRRFTRRSR
jgi:membrane-associated phospholipid phosphatase